MSWIKSIERFFQMTLQEIEIVGNDLAEVQGPIRSFVDE